MTPSVARLLAVGMLNGVVIALEPGSVDPDDVPRLLPDLARWPRHESGWWDLAGVTGGDLSADRHPLGYDLLTARFSSNDHAGDPARTENWCIDLFAQVARQLPAHYGYFTRYQDWLTDRLLAEQLTALREGRASDLRSAPHTLWFFGPSWPGDLAGPARAQGWWGAVLGASTGGPPVS